MRDSLLLILNLNLVLDASVLFLHLSLLTLSFVQLHLQSANLLVQIIKQIPATTLILVLVNQYRKYEEERGDETEN